SARGAPSERPTTTAECAAAANSSRSPRQVDQREQEDPDDIDEMPVEPGNRDRRMVAIRIGALRGPQPDHHEHDDADGDMQRMEASRDEIESEEQRHRPGLRPREIEIQAWNE